MLTKKTVYLALAMLLGLTLGDIAYDVLEMFYLSSSIVQGVGWYSVLAEKFFALQPLPEIIFDMIGAFGGYYLGKIWWRIIYVEDRRKKNYKLNWR
jgi:hypothetical protein